MNFDRNIVIEASAGTGKTYTLVQTILEALFQKKLKMDELVALTFTKKAAGEMKERIATELQKIDSPEAREALETIDRAAIGTIHSYAFSLLKRFPLAAGISPAAEVDEKGVRSDDLFETEWPKWLKLELAADSSLRKEWLEVLERIPLSSIREITRRLCDFDIPLAALPLPESNLKKDLEPMVAAVRQLLANKPANVKSSRIAQSCEEVFGAARSGRPLEQVSAEALESLHETPSPTNDWLDQEVKQLKILRQVAMNLLARGDRTLALLTDLIKPFVTQFREQLLAEGILSNNALLVLARDLVAKNFQVRETLKRQIRQIFVDEFQDTDPLQGELLLFLAENAGGHAKTWKDVALEPGKLFIVGDPKQSIYLFRGADISAYSRFTALVLQQGGERRILEESYRSHDHIIHAVNAAFASLIQEKHPVSPAYQPLVHRRKAKDPERHRLELRLAYSTEPRTSDESLAMEAQDAARWIAEAHAAKRWTFKDIALVFRSTPAMTPFIERLRQLDIPFVVEGERYFYRAPEVTDVLNLLRALDDSGNRIALAGFLRSPLGGFNDIELVDLAKSKWKLDSKLILSLRARVGREPLKSILNHVYDDTFLLELAARSYHRDQTIANLLKLKRLMESFAEEGETTLRGLLTKIDRFMEDDRLEGESPLADETYDAVRLLTIHKAKGLEFPVVWLPGLHRSTGGDRDSNKISAGYDWSTERLGIALGRTARNMTDFALAAEMAEREAAEEARVLYVAMTRARDHLILSGGVCSAGRSKQPAKGSFLDKLAGAWRLDLESLTEGEIPLGEGVIVVNKSPAARTVSATDPVKKSWLDALDPAGLAKSWLKREVAFQNAMETPLVVTPTSFGKGAREQESKGERSEFSPVPPRPHAPMLGTLVHRFLEAWDFAREKCDMPAQLRRVANAYFAGLGTLREPFPDPKEGGNTTNPPELIETVDEAQRLLADFIGSVAEDEIKTSTIIGREVPFFYAHGNAVMRGVMDILYRTPDGKLVIGDYKTDAQLDAAKYTDQAKAYTAAVSQALGEKALFKLIQLREESAVSP